MRNASALFVCVLFFGACDFLPTDPSDVAPILRSELGFKIRGTQAYLDGGATVTQAHADMADQAWRELMDRLRKAGFENADPDGRVAVTIWLHLPEGPDELIHCGGHANLVGGCYGNDVVRVPGNYPSSTYPKRRWSQPLMHEFLHHFCAIFLGSTCTIGSDKLHEWPAPNDASANIWLLTFG